MHREFMQQGLSLKHRSPGRAQDPKSIEGGGEDTAAYAAAGSTTKRARTARRMIVVTGEFSCKMVFRFIDRRAVLY